jgi:hypothetical protein
MSANKGRPHVLVLPEDGANLELANGFHQKIPWSRQRQLQVLPPAGGWSDVIDRFTSEHVADMVRWPTRSLVLLVDFDGRADRLEVVKAAVPPHLADRVFVLGSWTEPEDLKRALGSCEDIGAAMADDCVEGTNTTWGHELLRHNASELERMRESLYPVLFPNA